jgi:hypothetical protein
MASADSRILCNVIAGSVKAKNAIIDGKICCMDDNGRSQFNPLLFRRSAMASTRSAKTDRIFAIAAARREERLSAIPIRSTSVDYFSQPFRWFGIAALKISEADYLWEG